MNETQNSTPPNASLRHNLLRIDIRNQLHSSVSFVAVQTLQYTRQQAFGLSNRALTFNFKQETGQILSSYSIDGRRFGAQDPTSKDSTQLIPQTGGCLPKQRLISMTQRQGNQPTIGRIQKRTPLGQLHAGHRLIVAPTHLLQHRMPGL